MSVLQHVHYYSTYTCFHPSEPEPNSRNEIDKNESKNGQIRTGFYNENIARMHNNYTVNIVSTVNNNSEYSFKRIKLKNRENYENGNLGSVCIAAPLGIVSLPSSTSLPSPTEQNLIYSLIGGQFGSISLSNNNNGNNNNNSNNNNNMKLNSNFIAPIRFLAFQSVHLSLSSVLPLILSHSQPSIGKNNSKKDDKNNAKNTTYYGAGFTPNKGENKPIIEEILPPISANFARDLCVDLFSAIDHCIQW
jgi:hypothetical protein